MEIVDDDKTTHAPTSVGNDLDLLAERALEFVQAGSTVGLGSGRAARVFVRALGRRAQRGLTITCVATSEVTARLAAEVGLRAVKLDETPLDLTVDGADEVDPDLSALKGSGGALVCERIVARRLGTADSPDSRGEAHAGPRQPRTAPAEVLPFAVRFCAGRLRQLGFAPEVRQEGGRPLVTDSGNFTLDCETAPLADPAMTKRAIDGIPGVVDTGLFLGTAERVLVANRGCVRELRRKGS